MVNSRIEAGARGGGGGLKTVALLSRLLRTPANPQKAGKYLVQEYDDTVCLQFSYSLQKLLPILN